MFKILAATSTIAILAQGAFGIITEITSNTTGTPKCLDVQGGNFTNGTAVQIFDCNGSAAQDWRFERNTPTSVKLFNTNFCLDAGLTPGDGTKMKIWECFDGLEQQTWFYTDDNRIALNGKGLCLDLTDGNTTNGNQVQIWTCTDNNRNQVWIPVNLR